MSGCIPTRKDEAFKCDVECAVKGIVSINAKRFKPVSALTTPYKLGTFTLATAPGNQSITGVGFSPASSSSRPAF